MVVLIKGAGDLATGVACRLFRAGFPLLMTDMPWPTAVRRSVSLAQAVFDGQAVVEGVEARLAPDLTAAHALLSQGVVPVLTCPVWQVLAEFQPAAMVDAVIAKENLDTNINDAPVVIALGPGFTAGVDCHAVVETQRGHDLGRVLRSGSAFPNTGVPGPVGGYSVERVIRAPGDGLWQPLAAIGERVILGQPVGQVGPCQVNSLITGMVRGMLPCNTPVHKGMKAGDVDPRADDHLWQSVSDKANAIGGGVLEALLALSRERGPAQMAALWSRE